MKTVNGVKKTVGLITIKIKIFEIEEEMDLYIIKEEDFDDFIIGLDMINIISSGILCERTKLLRSRRYTDRNGSVILAIRL